MTLSTHSTAHGVDILLVAEGLGEVHALDDDEPDAGLEQGY